MNESTIETLEQEFIDYVNASPKKELYSSVDLGVSCSTDLTVFYFISLCHRSLHQIPVELRRAATVWIDDNTIEFRARREETSDEHIERCRREFEMASLLKHRRRMQYEQLKREFGDA